MNVLIPGGTGFIGQALKTSLAEDGHQVTILSRSAGKDMQHRDVKIVQWDAKTAGDWVQHLETSDAVVNLVGENIGGWLWTRRRKAEILNSRVNAGKAIVEGIRKASHKPSVLVQASAMGWYGTSLTHTFTEADHGGSDWLAEVAARWEETTKDVEDLGVRRVIIRSGHVLSKPGGLLNQVSLPFKLFVGGKLGSGDQWWSWIHLRDEIGAIRFLMDHPETRGVYNLTTSDPRPNKEFARVLGHAMHRPAWFPVPSFLLKLILGELSFAVLEGQRVIPRRLQEAGYEFSYPRLEPALEEIFRK